MVGAGGVHLDVWRGAEVESLELVGDELTLGRAPDNTVSFPSDESVSRHHAVLERRPAGWCLRDLASSNGTYVNGHRTGGEHVLQTGDEIVIGQNRIVFRDAGPESAQERTDAVPSAPPVSSGYLDLSEEWGSDHARAASTPPSPPQAPPPSSVEGTAPPLPPPPPPPPRTEPPATTPSVPPPAGPQRGGAGTVRGLARNIQTRKADNQTVLAFRLDRYDVSGNRLAPVAVEFPGYQHGQISEGEEVEVRGKWSHGTLRAKRVINLTTSAEVKGPSAGVKIFYICVIIAFVCFFAFIIYSIVTAPQVTNPFE